jgi:predicted Zn-dependent protease
MMPPRMPTDRHRRRTSIFSQAAEVAVALAIALPIAALGGALPIANWLLVVFAMAALALASLGAARQGQRLHWPLLAFALAGFAALCALQLLPLPQALLAALSPPAAELAQFALAPLGLTGPRPISLDPPATWRELAKHLSYLCLLLAAAQLARSQSARRRLLVVVGGLGLAVALVGLGHLLLGADALGGQVRFAQARPALLTPFGNSNHLAAFLTLGAGACLGAALSASARHWAWLWGLGYVLSGTALALSLSRGGIAFFVVGQLAFGLLLLRAHRERGGKVGSALELRAPRYVWAVTALLAAASAAAFIAYERIAQELSTADSLEKVWSSKVFLWPMFAGALPPFLWAGMGRGAFEGAFTRFHTEGGRAIFSHPESWPLQLGLELGLAGLLLGVFALWALASALRRARLGVVELAALCALLALGLHDLFDFSLELPATAAAAAVLAGLLVRPERDAPETFAQPPRPMALGAGAALAVSLLALWAGRSTFADAEGRLGELLAARAPAPEVQAAALPLISTHPTDYLLYAMVAQAYAAGPQASAANALAFANRALFLRPLDAESHRIAARALLRLGRRAQAMLEYRLAYAAGARHALEEAAKVARGVDELWAIIPPEPPPLRTLAMRLWALGRQEEALALLERAREQLADRVDAAPLWSLSAFYLSARGQVPDALSLVEEARRRQPHNEAIVLHHATVLVRAQRRPEAIALLAETLQRAVGSLEVALLLSRQLHAQGERTRAFEVLGRQRALQGRPADRARVLATEAELLRAEKRHAKALESYQLAARLAPSPSLHFAAAELLEQLRRPKEALRELEEAVRRLGREPARVGPWRERLTAQVQELEALREQVRALGEGALP